LQQVVGALLPKAVEAPFILQIGAGSAAPPRPFPRVIKTRRYCPTGFFSMQLLRARSALLVAVFCEALAAIDGTITLGNEGYGSGFAALGAHGLVLLARSGGTGVFAGDTALFAAGGFVLETFFGVEFLFACGEHELSATVAARERFVLIHGLEFLRFRMSDRNG
jgi:hypothetical protein